MRVEGETETHDLVVSLENLWERSHLETNNTLFLNMTVRNSGTETEKDITFQLLIDNETKQWSIIDELRSGYSFWSSYSWSPTTDGDYNLTVYASPVDNETDTADNNATRWVRVSEDRRPVPIFTFSPIFISPNIVEKGEVITFNASASFDPDWGNITWYHWNIRSINSTVVKNETDPIATHPFTWVGSFTVNLTLGDTENQRNWTSTTLIVEDYPTVSFSVSNPPGCKSPPPYYVNRNLTFNAAASKPDGGSIVSYRWDFNDSTPILIENDSLTTHVYTVAGNYTVNLTVTDNLNLTESSSKTIEVVVGRPVADFTVSPALPGPYYANETTITFDARASYDPDNYTSPYYYRIAKYKWDFGDGNVTEITNPVVGSFINHMYSTKGPKTVKLTVFDYEGFNGSKTLVLTISPRVYLKVEPTLIQRNPGDPDFKVNITITDVVDLRRFFLKLTWSANVLECTSLKYGYGNGTGFLGPEGDVIFTQHHPSGRGYAWANATQPYSGKSGSGTLVTLTFNVLKPGNSTLRFAVAELYNSASSLINRKTVNGTFYTTVPVADFDWSPKPCVVKKNVTFDAKASYDPDEPYDPTPGPFKNYTWNFADDNTTGVGERFNHTYLTPGNYDVTLTVVDDDNETSQITKEVWVASGDDVAVIDIRPKENETAGILPINITFRNKGDLPVTFDVTVYANTTVFNFTSITLPKGDKTIEFKWNTKGFAKGNYIIWAYATPVPDEANTTDNNCTNGVVKAWGKGNVNKNNVCDGEDLVLIIESIVSYPGHGKWYKERDLNHDDVVDGQDSILCIEEIPTPYPP